MEKRPARLSRAAVLRKIFTSPFYILLTVVAAIAYYWLLKYQILASNKGVFFITVPMYWVYALILSAAALMAVSIYAVSNLLRTKYAGVGGGLFSIITSSIGGLVISCSCYAPVLASVMYAIGFGVLQVGDTIAFLGDNQLWFVLAFIAVNLIFIYYQLGRITRIGGAHRR